MWIFIVYHCNKLAQFYLCFIEKAGTLSAIIMLSLSKLRINNKYLQEFYNIFIYFFAYRLEWCLLNGQHCMQMCIKCQGQPPTRLDRQLFSASLPLLLNSFLALLSNRLVCLISCFLSFNRSTLNCLYVCRVNNR